MILPSIIVKILQTDLFVKWLYLIQKVSDWVMCYFANVLFISVVKMMYDMCSMLFELGILSEKKYFNWYLYDKSIF